MGDGKKRYLSISYVPDDADTHYDDMGFEVESYEPEDVESHITDMGFDMGFKVGSYYPDDADTHYDDMGFKVESYEPEDVESHITDMGFDMGFKVGSYYPDDADRHYDDMGFKVESYEPEDVESHVTDMEFDLVDVDDLGFRKGTYVHDMACVVDGIKLIDGQLNVTDCTQYTVANIPTASGYVSPTEDDKFGSESIIIKENGSSNALEKSEDTAEKKKKKKMRKKSRSKQNLSNDNNPSAGDRNGDSPSLTIEGQLPEMLETILVECEVKGAGAKSK